MLNEWSDRDPEPLSPWEWIIGAIVVAGSVGGLVQLLLFCLGY